MAKKKPKQDKTGSPGERSAGGGSAPVKKVRFHYIKSNHFRVIHVDGAHGGITPTGMIQVAFHNDRSPIPQQVVSTVHENGTLGREIAEERVSRDGVVREVEVEAIMSLDTARALRKWLDEKIQSLEDLLELK